jgi:serine/threonine protein phosphatase PrpC
MSTEGWDEDARLLPDGFPPMPTTVRAEFGAQSRRGRRHANNGDHFLVVELGRHQQALLTSLPETAVPRRFNEYGYGMVVVDGLGGPGTGEPASRLALSTLMELMVSYGRWSLRVNERTSREIMARAERFLQRVHTVLTFERPADQPQDLQAALTVVWGAGRDIFFAHVGHTRAYLYRDGELFRLTRDHTVARELEAPTGSVSFIDLGVAARDFQHVLTRALGARGQEGTQFDLERFRLGDEDLLLVCSNGVTDALSDRDIAAILKSHRGPADLCVALVERAQAINAEDDATALIGRYHIPRASDGEGRARRPPR